MPLIETINRLFQHSEQVVVEDHSRARENLFRYQEKLLDWALGPVQETSLSSVIAEAEARCPVPPHGEQNTVILRPQEDIDELDFYSRV